MLSSALLAISAPVSAEAIYRVDCGAAVATKDTQGNIWQRDRIYCAGKTDWGRIGGERASRIEQVKPGEDISVGNTDNERIYQTETYSDHSYIFKLQPGKYHLRLHFAETYRGCTGPGFRTFSVYANDKPILNNFDVFAESGGLFKAIYKDFEITTKGDLKLDFRSGSSSATIAGIEISGDEQVKKLNAKASRSVYLDDEKLKVEVDSRYPVVRSYELKGSGLKMAGNILGDDEDTALTDNIFTTDAFLDGKYTPTETRLTSSRSSGSARYYYYSGFSGEKKLFSFRVGLSVEKSALCMRIDSVREYGGCQVKMVHFNRYRPLSLTGESDNNYLAIDNDLKPIADTPPYVWRNVPYALLAAKGVSASIYCNQVDPGGPLEVSLFNTKDGKRAAGIGPHTFYHRVKSRVLHDFEMRIGVVSDYNLDGRADWIDAANWLGDQIPSKIPEMYAKSHIDKYFMCIDNNVSFSIDQCRERMMQLYHLTNGSPHLVYLVGWQYKGHDSEYPAMDVVNEKIGGREKLLALMNDGHKYNFNFSFHFNFDDAYETSPDWDPSIIGIGGDGNLAKGGIWGGNQCYIISPYKLVKSGKAKRMVDHLTELYPLKDSIHLDVLSAVPWRSSEDKDDPSDSLDNLMLGKLEIMKLFKDRGIDVTSEWASYPFVGPMTYFWHAGLIRPNKQPINAAILHGRVLYGGWRSDVLSGDASFVPEYLTYGAMADNDFAYSTPLSTVLDIEFLLDKVGMLLNQKRMTGFTHQGNIFRADYGKDSFVKWNQRTNDYEVYLDKKLIAKNCACIVPTQNGDYLIYSRDEKEVMFTLPESLKRESLRVMSINGDGTKDAQPFEVCDNDILLNAHAHVPYLITARRE